MLSLLRLTKLCSTYVEVRFCYHLNIYHIVYGTAQFKLEAHVQVTHVLFRSSLEYFSKSCVFVDNCTRILLAIHGRVMSPDMLVYVRACTHLHIRNFDCHE